MGGTSTRQNAFAVLLECITAAQQSGDLPAGDPLPLAWTAWSFVHGIAKLAISGNLPLNASSTIEFTRSASRIIFNGMKAGPIPLRGPRMRVLRA